LKYDFNNKKATPVDGDNFHKNIPLFLAFLIEKKMVFSPTKNYDKVDGKWQF